MLSKNLNCYLPQKKIELFKFNLILMINDLLQLVWFELLKHFTYVLQFVMVHKRCSSETSQSLT